MLQLVVASKLTMPNLTTKKRFLSVEKRRVVQDDSEEEEDDFKPAESGSDDDDDMSDFVVDDDKDEDMEPVLDDDDEVVAPKTKSKKPLSKSSKPTSLLVSGILGRFDAGSGSSRQSSSVATPKPKSTTIKSLTPLKVF